MGKYSDFNIISIGDHCAIPIILRNLNLRKESYPFDWVSHTDGLHNTNIIYNVEVIKELKISDNVDNIVKNYIGDALDTHNKVNTVNSIWFPHDAEENVTTVFEKYKRRFLRLKNVLDKKNIFIFLTRHKYIEEDVFQKIVNDFLNYNKESIIVFISGTNHTYFQNMNNDNVIFQYIEYDISKYFEYDYNTFRPNVEQFLSNLLV